MPEPLRLNDDQLAALDEVIAAVETGELTPREVADAFKAPVNNQQNQGGTVRAVVTAVTVNVATVAVIVTWALILGARQQEGLPASLELPDEISLDQLLQLRGMLGSGPA
jgi:hypothetical protein